MIVVRSWKESQDVRNDLKRFIRRRNVRDIGQIRRFLYARYGLTYAEAERLVKAMCQSGELRWHFWARYSAPGRKKGRDVA